MTGMTEIRVGKRGEQKLRWDRENTVPCECGRARHARESPRCVQCRDDVNRARRLGRWTVVAGHYRAGLKHQEIADLMGVSYGSVNLDLVRMRKAGWDVPCRRGGYGS